MKKVVLFALLLATFVGSAHAISGPRLGVIYACYYSNYTGDAVSPGWSFWQKRAGGSATLIYTTEHFQTSWGSDGYLATWAKPFDTGYPYYYTRWEFTFNPNGPQCKDTRVYGGGTYIEFRNCTDGHSRTCWTEAP